MKRVSVRVFIDDYAADRLPDVCVFSGADTTDRVKFRSNVGFGNPFVWLLLFLGPIGWLILLLFSFAPGNYIEGWLPFTHEIATRQRRDRWRIFAFGVGGALAMLLAASLTGSQVFVALAIGAVLLTMVLVAISLRNEPRLSLDASRRWLTIRGVHPRFASAVEERSTVA
ncbi:MAG TPA: hypothetical protein VFS66_09340 [Acidimicrobiia bacterium]|nr:hypothetical protein [Acidimicrobiia bacterium]